MLVLCKDELVVAVHLNEAIPDPSGYDEAGAELWRIEAVGQQGLTTFVVGSVPPGFVERRALPPQLPPRMVPQAEMDGGLAAVHGSFFKTADLRTGLFLQNGGRVSEGSLRRAARENCTSNPFVLFGLPGWLGWVAVPVIALGSLLGARTMTRRRRLPREPIGGWPPPAAHH